MTFPAGPTTTATGDQLALNFTAPVDDEVDIKDFTIKRKRIKFKIDEDVFEASRILGIPMMQDLVKVTKGLGNMSDTQDYSPITKIFSELLVPASAARFNERLMQKGDEGIDVREQLLPILHYVLEKFGVRPTQPSSDSSTGSPSETDGTTSTDGSSPETSTSSN